MDKLPISAGMLSWKAPKTVANTIAQYQDFPARLAEFKVFFQQISDSDKAVATAANLPYIGREDNVGIQGGIKWVVESLTSEYVIFLENDFNLCVSVDEAVKELQKSLDWLKSGKVDMVRLRSRFNPGVPCGDPDKYFEMYRPVEIDPRYQLEYRPGKGNKLLQWIRPGKAGRIAARGAYVEKNPELVFPKIFTRDEVGLITSSKYLNWTNNPTLIRRDLFLQIIARAEAHPSSRTVGGMQDLEKPLNSLWWRAQDYKIGLIDGIFTHNRLDR